MLPGLDMVFDDGAWRVGLAHNVLFTAIGDAPAPGALAAVARGQTKLLELRGPVAGLTIIVGMRIGRLRIDESMRIEIAKMMRVKNLRGHSAIAIESDGFAGATVRAMLSAVILLSRPESPQKVVDSRVDGARYLIAHSGVSATEAELVACADALTAGLC